MMAETPNAEHLSKGSGVNRSSARPDAKAADAKAAAAPERDSEPRYGERRPTQDS